MPEVLVRDETESVGPAVEQRLARAVTHVLVAETGGRCEGAEVSVTVVASERIHALNRQWRAIDRPTDVLSFPACEEPLEELGGEQFGEVALGDIVLCPTEVPGDSAEEWERGMVLLAVHGTLHLLGYDHADEEEQARMFALQERYTEEVLGR